MTLSSDVFPGLPPDLRDIGKSLYHNAVDATYDVADAILDTLKNLGQAKGDPEALQKGETMIRVDVKSQITQAKTNLQASLDGFNRFGGWQGSAANAFMDYTPRLIAAITTLETSCETTADAIAAFRAGLMEIWATVISETSKAVGQTIGALSDKKNKAKLVVNIINAWVSWAGNLWAAYVKLDEAKYKALDKIGQALSAPPGLVTVKGRNDLHYDGPTGFQLPMPTEVSLDPNWSTDAIRQRWQIKPGASVEVQTEPFKKLIQGLRDNGDFWNAAYKKQIDAWFAMPQKAFSIIGGPFYEKLSSVLARDYITYLYSDQRMEHLANLMDEVRTSYGQTDAHAGTLFREYIANE